MASSSYTNDLDRAIDETVDQYFDQVCDQTFENLSIAYGVQQETINPRKRRAYIERNREEGHNRLWNDYFAENSTYPANLFRRRFRMNKPLFLHIVERLSNEIPYFQQRNDGSGRPGLSALQKCSVAIRLLAYGTAFDTVDEYLRLGATTARKCLEHFVEGIIVLFGDEYQRRPTPQDLRLLAIRESRGFLGMIGSIDCMHWEWKNCPTAWRGQFTCGSGKPTIVLESVASYDLWIWHAFFGPPSTLNDINVLDRSPVFDDIIQGRAPQGQKSKLFATTQESVRKDVERAFGVLQARFAIIKNPALSWDKAKISKIMRACIILHNMIVEDERDEWAGYTQYNVAEFQQGDGNGNAQVDQDYSTNQPTNIANMFDARNRVRDSDIHKQLKKDLVDHIWQKFGHLVGN
ncbi:uncharacterized protein LOC112086648 [Eutrema salsugineum]|uniref:uncharacterized protein LOC112086648 n=1 Tax=Eutrema salsugineum TaxID=72664 RepID=UPI000CED5701|nr:uncharacterized protein LOC112086648 [Eutrema salsugineum]